MFHNGILQVLKLLVVKSKILGAFTLCCFVTETNIISNTVMKLLVIASKTSKLLVLKNC